MSKKSIRPHGAEGISHPRTVTKSPLTVNDLSTQRLLNAVDADLLVWTKVSIDALEQLDALFKTMKQMVDDNASLCAGALLERIGLLAALGSRVAAHMLNEVDCSRERYEEFAAQFRDGGAA